MIKVGMVSLGCPKNQVDAEMMLYTLKQAGFQIVSDENDADAVIINTCGFIEDAKREAIENILEVAELKKSGLRALIVSGCLAERYGEDIVKEFPEVDAVVGIGENANIAKIVQSALSGTHKLFKGDKYDLDITAPRILSTPKYSAYVKIAEGCDNCCTYCAIPSIRGRFRSRPIESVLSEIEDLARRGTKEIILVAQDTTRYGEDIYGVSKLPELIKAAAEIDGVQWIRTLYTYPERITDELLEVIKSEPKAVRYLDIPIQHCNGEILKRMNRLGNRETLAALIKKIRGVMPDITLRTTLITGFPGETEAQFEELCEFVNEMRFDNLGCFSYSEEEGTVAATFPDKIDPQLRSDRAEIIMNDQLRIVNELNEAKIGKTFKVLVEGYDDYIKCYFGRAESAAPDIDGKVFFMSEHPVDTGEFVNVKINDTIEYDLLGEAE